jgi:hypothetical protein
MELIPTLEFGWLNGWILLALEFLIQGSLLLIFPKDVVARLFDRSGWTVKQRIFTIAGKVFSLVCPENRLQRARHLRVDDLHVIPLNAL